LLICKKKKKDHNKIILHQIEKLRFLTGRQIQISELKKEHKKTKQPPYCFSEIIIRKIMKNRPILVKQKQKEKKGSKKILDQKRNKMGIISSQIDFEIGCEKSTTVNK
jgi:hypothetical protein